MMKNVKIYIAVVVVALAAVIGGFMLNQGSADTSGQAVAATSPAAGGQTWFVRCGDGSEEEAKSKEPRRGRCEMFQRLNVAESGQRLVEFAIGYPEGKENAQGIFILPLGILLKPGVSMTVGDNPPLTFSVRYCDGNGCFAFVSLNDQVINMLKSGDKAVIAFKAATGKALNIEMPLTGFSKAYKEISS